MTELHTIDRAVDDGHHRQNHNLRHIFDLASHSHHPAEQRVHRTRAHRFRIKIRWDTSYDYQSRATLEKWSTGGWTQVEAMLPVEVKDLHGTEKKLIDLARQFLPPKDGEFDEGPRCGKCGKVGHTSYSHLLPPGRLLLLQQLGRMEADIDQLREELELNKDGEEA